jgi:hypothetical protein
LWVVSFSEGPLYRTREDQYVPVFADNEPNPFFKGGGVYEALIDPRGNAFLRTDDISQDEMFTYAIVRAPAPPPLAKVSVEKLESDSVRVKMSTDSKQAVWFAWKLDNNDWQPMQREAETQMNNLSAGNHHLEVQAVDDKLQASVTNASVWFNINIDPQEHIQKLIAMLSSEKLEDRETAAQALERYGKAALAPLKAARENAGDSQQWWIDAVTQQINDSASKQKQSVPQ